MRDIYTPDAGQWIGALEAGQQAGMTRQKNQATRRAGSLMTSGDYQGAAAAVGPYDMQTAAALQNMGVQKAATARKSGYGQQIAAGQGDAAVKSAYGAGDFEIAADMQKAIDAADDRSKATAHEHATRVAEIVAPLGGIPDLAQRKAYIQQHATDLKAAGYTDQQIATFEPTDQNLATVYTQALGLKDYIEKTAPKVVGDALVRTPIGGGKPEVMYEGTKLVPVPEGGKLVPVTGGHVGGPGSVAPAAGAQVAAAGAGGPSGGFEAVYHGFVAPHEGGYTASDGNGAPANFGINQKANPEVDVKNLTADAAKTIFHDKYWVPSGADKLPPALQAVQFDTAVNMGVAAAQNLLQQSGGDPQKYLQLREQRYRAIAAADPSKAAKLPTWLDRNSDLAHFIQGQAAAPPAQGGLQAGDPPGTVYGNPKPTARPATPAEKAQYGVGADVPAQVDAQGNFHVITGTGATNKKVPAAIQQGYASNQTNIQQIDNAIALLKARPSSMGLANMVGDEIRQRTDVDGIKTRAAVANVGAVKIHDLSGAAVTAAETPRLKPFIPMPTDTAQASIAKLEGLKEQIQNNNRQIEVQFGEESGYAPMGHAKAAPTHPAAAAAAPAAHAATAQPAAPKPAHQMTDAEIKAALGLH